MNGDGDRAGQVIDSRTRRERIAGAADRVDQCHEAWKLAIKQRDRLIVEACEAFESERDVARWARLSQPRVNGILAAH